MDLHTFERDPQTVAVRLAASDLFGVLQRSVRLPPGCGGLVYREDGSAQLVAPGGMVEGRQTREVIAIRATPLKIFFDETVESSDHFSCHAGLTVSISVIPERSEFEAFCRTILGSSRRADVRRVELHLRDVVQKALHEFAAENPTETLLHSGKDEEFVKKLGEVLKPATFSAGLALGRDALLEIESPAYVADRQRLQQAAEQKQRQEREQQAAEAAGAARLKHVEQLSAVLDRLDGLAKQRPGVSMGELIRTFDGSERAELYKQLVSREVSARRTAAIAVVAGTELLLFDPNDGAVKLRRVFEGALGALRSVRRTMHDGVEGFLLGAARGVYHFVPMTDRVSEYSFDPPVKLRGGVNAAVIVGGILYATHSEMGVLRWEMDSPWPGRTILQDQTQNATAVRDIQSDGQATLWFSAGERVVGWSPESGALGAVQSTTLPKAQAEAAADRVGSGTGVRPAANTMGTLVSVGSIAVAGGTPRVSALCISNGVVYAGTSDGRLLAWPCAEPGKLETILSGEGGGVESVQWLSGLGVERLLVACRRPAAWLLVRGDACRMEYRSDEPLRWAAAADDWVIGVTDRRDRIQLWRPARPEVVERTIWVGRLAGHSIQDAAVVPQSGI